MSRETLGLPDHVVDYIREVTVQETSVERRCREETSARDDANMQISAEQGQVMKWIVRTVNAERTLEVGTFTGYSALCTAGALPESGELVACELSEDFARQARQYAADAGLGDKIDIRVAPALETLEALRASGAAGTFDFAFIDADKVNYVDYYDHARALVGAGGVIAVDNTLWSGSVADPDDDDESTRAIRKLNERMARDDGVTSAMIPVGDGLMVALRHE
jgi:caffeoyl-CoA O-methyltransferase